MLETSLLREENAQTAQRQRERKKPSLKGTKVQKCEKRKALTFFFWKTDI